MKRWTALLLMMGVLLTGCTGQTPLSKQTVAMDTACCVTMYDGDAALLDDCIAHLAARDALWSKTADGDVGAVNAANGKAVTVSAQTSALLSKAIDYSVTSDGAFDITTQPLSSLWDAAQSSGVAPDEAALSAALSSVGREHIRIDGNIVTLTDGAQIDLGAIAKGAVCDELVTMLRDGGCTSALVDLGGNIYALGNKQGEPFHVGIAHPLKEGALAVTVAVENTAVVTSGSYERGFTVDGTRYSHILDPHTGRPVDHDLASVTILSPSATEADALSTACFVKGYDGAMALLSHYPNAKAVFVMTDGRVVTTDGVTVV